MCGIVGAIADRDVVPVLIEGLKRLEYRGYDSAGIAVVDQQDVRWVRRTGRVAEMEGAAAAEGFNASLGIGHTRWATLSLIHILSPGCRPLRTSTLLRLLTPSCTGRRTAERPSMT